MYFNHLGSVITNGATRTHETECRITMATAAFKQQKDCSDQQVGLKLKEKKTSRMLYLGRGLEITGKF